MHLGHTLLLKAIVSCVLIILIRSYPLKILNSIIVLNPVLVIHLRFILWVWDECYRY